MEKRFAISALFLASGTFAQSPTTAPTDTLSVITLHRQSAPAADVFSELSRQAGISIQYDGGTGPALNLNADGKPFWDVFIDACRQAKLGFTLNYNGNQPVLVVQKQTLGRTAAGGGVLAQFLNVRHWNRLVALPGDQEHCEIDVKLTWGPSVHTLFYELIALPTEAADENGKSLVGNLPTEDPHTSRPFGNYVTLRDQYDRDSNTGGQVSHVLRLQVPPDAGHRIARMRGALQVFIANEEKSATINNLKQLKSKAVVSFIKDTELTAEDVEVRDDSVNVQLVAKRNRGESDAAWNRRRALLSTTRFAITNASGQLWSSPRERGYVSMSWNAESLYLTASVSRDGADKGPPATLTITAADDVKQIDVPYDFSDLPLP